METSSQTLSSSDEDLTYWAWLQNQETSVWDLLSGDPLAGVDPSEVLAKPKVEKPSILPHIGMRDLNNTEDKPLENKPKIAVEVGLNISF